MVSIQLSYKSVVNFFMSSIRHIKHLSTTRSIAMLLVLVFVLDIMAHAGHDHSKEQVQHQAFGYCVGFSHLGATPSNTAILNIEFLVAKVLLTVQWIEPSIQIQIAAQPRAPPTH